MNIMNSEEYIQLKKEVDYYKFLYNQKDNHYKLLKTEIMNLK